MIYLMIPLLLAAVVGIVYCWIATYDEDRKGLLIEWRQATAWISVVAVTGQAALLAAMFCFMHGHGSPIVWIMRGEAFLFLIALLCGLTRRPRTRWWLFYCAIFMVLFSGAVLFFSQISS
jgi:hypothetical protein